MKSSLVGIVLALCGLIPTSLALSHQNESKDKLLDSRSHSDGTRFDVPRGLSRSAGNLLEGGRKGKHQKGGKKGNYAEADEKGGLRKSGKKGRDGGAGKKGSYGSDSSDSQDGSSPTPPSTFQSTVPSSQPTSDECKVVATCIPPIDPTDPQGGRFEDCNSIYIGPAECTESPTLLTFRFTGGDCLDSNNILDPNSFSCEDFFDGPPPSDDVGAEAYMIIMDNEGFTYFDGSLKVGEEFNITSFSPFHAAVNVTVYDGTPTPENIRETMIISSMCSEGTFLMDRYGVLQLIGFANPTQGYQQYSTSVSYDFSITSNVRDINVVLESLVVLQNLDPQNKFLNFTDDVSGIELNTGDTFVVSSGPINVDLSNGMEYRLVAEVRGTAPDGFNCRSEYFDFLNFTA